MLSVFKKRSLPDATAYNMVHIFNPNIVFNYLLNVSKIGAQIAVPIAAVPENAVK